MTGCLRCVLRQPGASLQSPLTPNTLDEYKRDAEHNRVVRQIADVGYQTRYLIVNEVDDVAVLQAINNIA